MSRLTSVIRLPKQSTFIFLAASVFCMVGSVYAFSEGGPGGKWPKSWPKELEPLRKQAWTWEHGTTGWLSFDIPFANQEEFESAWPHILKLKSKGAPITLLRGPHIRVKPAKTAGVRILTPLTTRTAAGELSSVFRSAGPTRAVTNGEATPSPQRGDNTPAVTGAAAVPVPPPTATLSETPSTGAWSVTSIVLVVDGNIVDLNRIRLPADTPIIDQRFTD